jgi:hypothetical protein
MPFACKVSEVIAYLQQRDQEEVVLCALWVDEDVQNLAHTLSTAQASTVLQIAAKHHDANLGINWETLQSAIDTAFPDRY